MQLFKGSFKFYDTHGLPLADIVMILMESGYVVDWEDFIKSAIKAGWKDEKIEAVIKEAKDEVLGMRLG